MTDTHTEEIPLVDEEALKAHKAQKITITKVMGGDKFRVDDPFFENGKGRYEFRDSRSAANSLKKKWSAEYGELSKDTVERSDTKSAEIRVLVDNLVPISTIAKQVGCRYQMAYNIAMKYLRKTGKLEAYERAIIAKKESADPKAPEARETPEGKAYVS